jgi:hypothetical protein
MIVACVALGSLTSRLIFSSSKGWLGSTWMRLVDGKVIRYLIIGANSTWVAHNKICGAMIALIFDEIFDIILRELTIETLLHILDFLCLDGVIVVSSRIIDESLVQSTLQKQVEVRHEAGIVTILVLRED